MTAEQVNDIMRTAREIAIDNGFSLSKSKKNRCKILNGIKGELHEAIECLERGHKPSDIWDNVVSRKPEGFLVELADFYIRLSAFLSGYEYISTTRTTGAITNIDEEIHNLYTLVVLGDLESDHKYYFEAMDECERLANEYCSDFCSIIYQKMRYNKTREKLHGKVAY